MFMQFGRTIGIHKNLEECELDACWQKVCTLLSVLKKWDDW